MGEELGKKLVLRKLNFWGLAGTSTYDFGESNLRALALPIICQTPSFGYIIVYKTYYCLGL